MFVRPMYETAEHLSAEQKLVQDLEAAWQLKAHKLKLHYEIDTALLVPYNNAVKYWVETKCRTNASDAYGTYMLSAHKWMRGNHLAASLGGEFRLVVRFTDKTLYVPGNVNPSELRCKIGGRVDRGDPQDIEPCVHIPMELFAPI